LVLSAQAQQLEAEISALRSISYDTHFAQKRTLEPIISLVKESTALQQAGSVLRDIGDIDADLKYFTTNRKLQRRISFEYLYL
jgi:hypothetical protein